jgi:hypothetical protein
MDVPFESTHALPVLETIRRLAKGQRLRSDTLRNRICEKTGLLPLEVEEGIRELHRRGLLSFQANARGQPVSTYVEFIREEVSIPPTEACWAASLLREGFNADAIASLNHMSSRLDGMAEADIQVLAMCLGTLRNAFRNRVPDDSGSNVSARAIMGSAKVISRIPAKAMLLLGLDASLQNPSPRYIIHAGPDQAVRPDITLLIENPQAFENAVIAGLADRMSLVCTFGFALTYLGHLKPIGAMTKLHEQPIVLQRSGRYRNVAELFNAPQIQFWGDLDIGALKIFMACRSAAPNLQLSAIYKAMEPLLLDPIRSHPYAELFDKEGQSRLSAFPEQVTNLEPGVQALFRRCVHRGVDQEVVDKSDIAQFGGLTY